MKAVVPILDVVRLAIGLGRALRRGVEASLNRLQQTVRVALNLIRRHAGDALQIVWRGAGHGG